MNRRWVQRGDVDDVIQAGNLVVNKGAWEFDARKCAGRYKVEKFGSRKNAKNLASPLLIVARSERFIADGKTDVRVPYNLKPFGRVSHLNRVDVRDFRTSDDERCSLIGSKAFTYEEPEAIDVWLGNLFQVQVTARVQFFGCGEFFQGSQPSVTRLARPQQLNVLAAYLAPIHSAQCHPARGMPRPRWYDRRGFLNRLGVACWNS